LSNGFDADLEPYIIPVPDDGYPYPRIFQVSDRSPFPDSDQLIRADRAGLQIDIGVPLASGLVFDLRQVAEAIPHLRGLRISESESVSGWGELSKASALEDFVILGDEPPEILDLSQLPALSNAGVVGERSVSVCANPKVQTLALRLPRSRLVPVILSPLIKLSLTSRLGHVILDKMVQPHRLRRLLVLSARDFDCRSLLRFPALEDVKLYSCNGVQNVSVLEKLPHLASFELSRCRGVDDPDAVSQLQVAISARES
jgi:hypothetical protein